MQPLDIKKNTEFVGRLKEIQTLSTIGQSGQSNIIIMYGRRRIGKTELLEQVFKERHILKFEGLEGISQAKQYNRALKQLAEYSGDQWLSSIKIKSWEDFFKILAPYVKEGMWTIYFEELQWLANYKGLMISELKFAWDNFFRHNPELIIILCGSSPSFMIDKVVHSKSLYNRSQYEMHLLEFNIIEACAFMKNKSQKNVLDAYLTLGGIPEYLKYINSDSSVLLGLCRNSFVKDSFFFHEYEKIFVSSLANNAHYEEIVEILSKEKFITRNNLAKRLGISSGGSLSKILIDLEKTGFILKYHPYDVEENSINCRYAINDNYLHFYYKYIKPIKGRIAKGDFDTDPLLALNTESYQKWLGYAFERWCRYYDRVIANILKFARVKYKSGAYFSRSIEKTNPGFQIDLIFDRADNVLTVCEIKYHQSKVGLEVVEEINTKCELLRKKTNRTIERVLICPMGAQTSVINGCYFDKIITLEDLLDEHNWKL